MKHFMFRYYVVIALVLFLATVVLVMLAYDSVDLEIIVTIIGVILSFVYFVQKQALEELRLFKELSTEFNQRYDRLNENLNRILLGDPDDELTAEELDVLNDYFNLCGEEYLFFKKGYIYPEVWKAWMNGMKIFYQDERIREFWLKELETDSYYGLRLE